MSDCEVLLRHLSFWLVEVALLAPDDLPEVVPSDTAASPPRDDVGPPVRGVEDPTNDEAD